MHVILHNILAGWAIVACLLMFWVSLSFLLEELRYFKTSWWRIAVFFFMAYGMMNAAIYIATLL